MKRNALAISKYKITIIVSIMNGEGEFILRNTISITQLMQTYKSLKLSKTIYIYIPREHRINMKSRAH